MGIGHPQVFGHAAHLHVNRDRNGVHATDPRPARVHHDPDPHRSDLGAAEEGVPGLSVTPAAQVPTDFLGVSDAVVNQPGHGALPRGQALRNPAPGVGIRAVFLADAVQPAVILEARRKASTTPRRGRTPPDAESKRTAPARQSWVAFRMRFTAQINVKNQRTARADSPRARKRRTCVTVGNSPQKVSACQSLSQRGRASFRRHRRRSARPGERRRTRGDSQEVVSIVPGRERRVGHLRGAAFGSSPSCGGLCRSEGPHRENCPAFPSQATRLPCGSAGNVGRRPPSRRLRTALSDRTTAPRVRRNQSGFRLGR